jgi:CRP-like cAMP-binding protein
MNEAAPAPLSKFLHKLSSAVRLSPDEQMAVLSLPCRRHRVAARHDIVEEGDHPTRCFLVLEGWLCGYKLLSSGRRTTLSLHVPCDLLTMDSLHTGMAEYGVASITPAEVAFISHANLLGLMAQVPAVAWALWRETVFEAAITREWLVNLASRPAVSRIAHLFCEVYLKLEAIGLASGHRCEFPLTQGELAEAVGMSVIHVNRSLRLLREEGIVAFQSHQLVIEDWAALVRVADFTPTYMHLRCAHTRPVEPGMA